jgi:hypothetical protein
VVKDLDEVPTVALVASKRRVRNVGFVDLKAAHASKLPPDRKIVSMNTENLGTWAGIIFLVPVLNEFGTEPLELSGRTQTRRHS